MNLLDKIGMKKLARVIWVIVGIVVPVMVSYQTILPLALQHETAPINVWVVCGMVALVGAIAGNAVGVRNYNAVREAQPDEMRDCMGVSMAYGGISGLILGGILLALLFAVSAALDVVEVDAAFVNMLASFGLMGASIGFFWGLLGGLGLGGYAAYGLSQGRPVGDL